MSVGCVLVAAGSGTRLGHGRPKALVEVAGRPLLEHALAGLAGSRDATGGPLLDHVVVVVPVDGLDASRTLVAAAWARCRGEGRAVVVAGGEDRQASVQAGIDALPSSCEVVLVHDAARAFCPPSLFAAVAAAVSVDVPAVVPGLPVADTVKRVDGPQGARRVSETLERAHLVTVQTPQGFRADRLRAVHALQRTGTAAGDDAGMLEAAGYPVAVVTGHPEAFKVTTPFDLTVAAAVLAGRGAGSP